MRVAAQPSAFVRPLHDLNGRVECFVPVIEQAPAPVAEAGRAPGAVAAVSAPGVVDFAKVFPVLAVQA
jgi:hypothetical protein